ncbi:sulfite exporter TauE/SafE family protein [Rubinisphaera margarita]|uniref:sulfite exporter TauE/SafE family protein n=1 Tax=Rubinisphaera margarita TaxID=2909586 RepID=UPI001EE7B558|nr:sulfite exporter TauE/SafE family protein [Rubinisphaera margarita]MCG6156225.1 sulfite exporter TauE/SafE family protein [Rubinisphaera margarita]
MEFETWHWILFTGVVVVSGFVQSALGFGYALVAMSVLPALTGVKDANLIVSFSAFAPLAIAAWSYRRHLVPESLLLAIGASLAALPIGLAVLVLSIDDILVRLTGIVILLMAIDGLTRRSTTQEQGPASKLWTCIAGAVSGFLAGAVTIGGPPIAIYAARRPWPPNQMKAFLTTFLLITSVVKLCALATTGLVNKQVLLLSAVAIPIAYVGGELGVRGTKHINAKLFRILTLIVLSIIATLMITRGA